MMERVALGKTGLEVNRLGFGGIPIQRVGETQAIETVVHAVEKGVDFIDTARGYTTSEHCIGMALKKTGKRVVLASKSHARTADEILVDLDTSLKALQKDCIDLYQCHFVRDENEYIQIISKGGALEALQRSKEEERIGHIGISTHSLNLADRILDDGFFETIMVCYSFLEPAAEEHIIPKALSKGVGVITMKPFSGGFIENARLALKYTLSQPGTVVIPGVEQMDLFDEDWQIFQGSYRLDEDEKRDIEKIRQSYDRRFCRRCDYCQPCSEGVPIQHVLGLPSMAKRVGIDFLRDGWRREAIEKARNCSECGECMTRCPYDLPIPELIKENLRWVDREIGPL